MPGLRLHSAAAAATTTLVARSVITARALKLSPVVLPPPAPSPPPPRGPPPVTSASAAAEATAATNSPRVGPPPPAPSLSHFSSPRRRPSRVSCTTPPLALSAFLTASPIPSSITSRLARTFSTSTSANMASATSFYDFKPVNSMSTLYLSLPIPAHILPFSAGRSVTVVVPSIRKVVIHKHTHPDTDIQTLRHREGRAQAAVRVHRQGCPHRQHGLQVRLHPAVRRPREALEGPQDQAQRRRLCHPRLPL